MPQMPDSDTLLNATGGHFFAANISARDIAVEALTGQDADALRPTQARRSASCVSCDRVVRNRLSRGTSC